MSAKVDEVAEEFIQDIRFEAISSSPYMKPLRMHFSRKNQPLFWDLSLEHDSVACIVYHRSKDSLLFVKQFRPPVFIRRVKAMPENAGKTIDEIDFAKYDISIGKTIELCAGLMDKPKLSPLETVQEELVEEVGYKVPAEKIVLLKRFISSVSMSGSHQHLFYTEVDDSMKVTEGGGVAVEGEIIDKVFMTIAETRKQVEETEFDSPAGLIFSITWFLDMYDKNTLPKL